jgi:hypothetical protein
MTKPKKATAPRPLPGGAEEQAKAVDRSKEILEITFRGETYHLAWRSVPLAEKAQVRAQAHIPWHDVTGEAGVEPDITTVAVLVWLARRAAGNKKLLWVVHQATWPDDLTIAEVSSRVVPPEELDLSDPQP